MDISQVLQQKKEKNIYNTTIYPEKTNEKKAKWIYWLL